MAEQNLPEFNAQFFGGVLSAFQMLQEIGIDLKDAQETGSPFILSPASLTPEALRTLSRGMRALNCLAVIRHKFGQDAP